MLLFDLLLRRRRNPHGTAPPTTDARPRVFSVSSTYEYERCPRRYRLAYVDRVPTERATAPEQWRFGTVVHRGLEAGYRHHQEVGRTLNLRHTIPTALAAVRAAWADEAMPADPRSRRRAERAVAGSLATARVASRDILGVERWFRATTDDGLAVAGATDLVLRAPDATVEIWDHKVTRYVRSPERLHGDLQLGVYAWLVRQTWPWADRIVGAHHYPLTRDVVRIDVDDEWMRTAMRRLTSTARRALADRGYAPTPGEHCSSCPFAAGCDAAPGRAGSTTLAHPRLGVERTGPRPLPQPPVLTPKGAPAR